jgi:competence protein ComEA
MAEPERIRQRQIGWIVLGSVVLAVGGFLLARSYFAGLAAAPTQEPDNANQPGAELLLAPATPSPASPPTPTIAPTPAPVVVYISGAVVSPDVYALPADARVKDVVLAAGGFTADAASERINLAAHIYDAQHIHVPRHGEPLPPDDERVPQDAPPAAGAAPGSDTININTASLSELAALPGIGDAMAQRILDYRTTNGPFATVEDLQNVRGIGPAILADIQGKVRVSNDPR